MSNRTPEAIKVDATRRAEMLLDQVSTALKNGEVGEAYKQQMYCLGFLGALMVVGVLDDDEFCAFRDSLNERCTKD